MLKRLFTCIVVLLLTGCAARRHTPEDAASKLAVVLGEPVSLQLHADGGPLDVATGEPGVLSVHQALRLSIRNDPRLQAALARVRVVEANVLQARLLPNPVLDVTLRYPGSWKPEQNLQESRAKLIELQGKTSTAAFRLQRAVAGPIAVTVTAYPQERERR